jgi:predicted GNAT family acetyltransferase
MAKSKNQGIPAPGIEKAKNKKNAIHYQFEKERNRVAAYDHNEHEVGDHTFVDPEIRGQNVAAYLIKIIVEQARNENAKIVPLCSYAKKEFMKIDEYKDILY